MARMKVFGTVLALLALAGCGSMEGRGVAGSGSGTEKFPPEDVDRLLLSVGLEIEIFGIGKDSFNLEGGVVVHRGGGQGPEGARMAGDLIAASLRGDSKVFGKVVAIESPTQRSPCEYEWKGPGAYRGHFDINGWFFLPGHDLIVFTKKPVRVEGPAERIPPVGQSAEGVGLPCELFDFRRPDSQPIGSLIKVRGKMLAKIGIQEDLGAREETILDLKSG